MSLTDTQKKILDVGKKEFLAHGFKDASLRGIVKKAGFTQGAFYGYYPDKASLFEALVSETANSFLEQFKNAQEAHFDLIPQDREAECMELSNEYLNHFINYIYDNFDAFKLILCCSEGTKYSDFIHDLVELETSKTKEYYKVLSEKGKIKGSVNHTLNHIITSAYYSGVFEIVIHDMPREEAILYVKELSIFFNSGWEELFKTK